VKSTCCLHLSVTQAQVLGLGVVMVGRKRILERKKYNGKIIETGVEIFS